MKKNKILQKSHQLPLFENSNAPDTEKKPTVLLTAKEVEQRSKEREEEEEWRKERQRLGYYDD